MREKSQRQFAFPSEPHMQQRICLGTQAALHAPSGPSRTSRSAEERCVFCADHTWSEAHLQDRSTEIDLMKIAIELLLAHHSLCTLSYFVYHVIAWTRDTQVKFKVVQDDGIRANTQYAKFQEIPRKGTSSSSTGPSERYDLLPVSCVASARLASSSCTLIL